MIKSKQGTGRNTGTAQEPFTTIDDLVQQAELLTSGLHRLAQYKHPLDIRRGVPGREGVKDVTEESKTIKAGARTYFFDVKRTKEGKSYLVITESRFKGEDEERERNSIFVFPENATEFKEALVAMSENLE